MVSGLIPSLLRHLVTCSPEVNWKKLYRLYREEKLTARKRGGRKRALRTRAPIAIP